MQRREGGAQLGMQGDAAPALLALGGAVLQVQRIRDLAFGIGDHRPGEGSDFLGPQPGLDRQQEQDRIALGVARGFQVAQEGGFLFGGQNLGLFALHGSIRGAEVKTHWESLYFGTIAMSVEGRQAKIPRNPASTLDS
jgi:hypothetical protein